MRVSLHGFLVSGVANQEFVWSWEEKQNGEIQFRYITLRFRKDLSRRVHRAWSCKLAMIGSTRIHRTDQGQKDNSTIASKESSPPLTTGKPPTGTGRVCTCGPASWPGGS